MTPTRRYPVFVRIDRCPRFLKVLAAAFAVVYLGKCIGDLVGDASLVYAEDILKAWDYFLR